MEQAEGNGYKIIDGERRWRAFEKLSEKPENQAHNKYATIEAIILDSHSAVTGLLANIARKEYNPLEYADALLALKKSLGKKSTDEEVSKLVGKSRVNITEHLRLHELPVEIQQKARNESVVPFNRLKNLAQSKGSNDEKINIYDKLHAYYKAKLRGEKPEKKTEDAPASNRATRHYLSVGKKLNNLKAEIESLPERSYEAGKEPSEDSKEALITELQAIMASAQNAINKLQGNTAS